MDQNNGTPNTVSPNRNYCRPRGVLWIDAPGEIATSFQMCAHTTLAKIAKNTPRLWPIEVAAYTLTVGFVTVKKSLTHFNNFCSAITENQYGK